MLKVRAQRRSPSSIVYNVPQMTSQYTLADRRSRNGSAVFVMEYTLEFIVQSAYVHLRLFSAAEVSRDVEDPPTGPCDLWTLCLPPPLIAAGPCDLWTLCLHPLTAGRSFVLVALVALVILSFLLWIFFQLLHTLALFRHLRRSKAGDGGLGLLQPY